MSALPNSWTFLLCYELSHSTTRKKNAYIFTLFPYLPALTETRFSLEDISSPRWWLASLEPVSYCSAWRRRSCLFAQHGHFEILVPSSLYWNVLPDTPPHCTIYHALSFLEFKSLQCCSCQISQWFQCPPSWSFQSTDLLVPWTLLQGSLSSYTHSHGPILDLAPLPKKCNNSLFQFQECCPLLTISSPSIHRCGQKQDGDGAHMTTF